MAREDPQLKIRLVEELKERIEKAAHENNRSLNAEITARLEESFTKESVWSDAVAVERLKHERALLGQIEFLTQRAGALGYGVQIVMQALKDGRMTKEVKAEIAKIKKDADQAIAAATKAMPDQVIKDIQAAQARAAELHQLIDSIKDVDL